MVRSGAAVALAGTLTLAGCGGGRLSHDAFVRRADAVCSAYHERVPLLTRPRSYEAVIAYVERTLPLHVAAFGKLAALEPPADDERAATAWLAAGRRVERALRRLRAAAMRHDPALTSDAADALQAASLAARRAAGSLGLETCSTP